MAVGVVNVQADATLQVGDGTETQRRRSAPATTLPRHPKRKGFIYLTNPTGWVTVIPESTEVLLWLL